MTVRNITSSDGIGVIIKTGMVINSATNRKMSPVPRIDTTSDRKAVNTLRRVNSWLVEEVIVEAESKGDEFNALQFKNITPNRITIAEREGINLYLFDKETSELTKPKRKHS